MSQTDQYCETVTVSFIYMNSLSSLVLVNSGEVIKAVKAAINSDEDSILG